MHLSCNSNKGLVKLASESFAQSTPIAATENNPPSVTGSDKTVRICCEIAETVDGFDSDGPCGALGRAVILSGDSPIAL
jgi:hypothetical protein